MSAPHGFFRLHVCVCFSVFCLTGCFFLRQEFEILSQIRQLQASCSQYSLPVNPLITSWVQAPMLLTDQERWATQRRHFLLKTKPFSMFPFLFHQSFKATSFPVTWSLPSIPVPVPQTLGAVASSIEKNLSCKYCKHLSFHMFSATILICNMSKPA